MSVGEFSIAERRPETRSSFKIREVSRTVIAAAQMAVDGVTLVILSYVSLSFAILVGHHDPNYTEYLIYLIPTISATLLMVFIFARSGVYDVLNNIGYIRVLRSTLKHQMGVILLLIACLFILKRSDDFSRAWLMMWTAMSAVVLCAVRLVTAGAAQRLIRDGRLTKNVAVVGANDFGHKLAARLAKEGPGMRLVGLFEERRSRLVSGCGDAAIMQSPSRLDGSRCVARMLRPPLLRLEQIDIAATRDVERMSLSAEHSAVLANER